jgi:hypothetical protein
MQIQMEKELKWISKICQERGMCSSEIVIYLHVWFAHIRPAGHCFGREHVEFSLLFDKTTYEERLRMKSLLFSARPSWAFAEIIPSIKNTSNPQATYFFSITNRTEETEISISGCVYRSHQNFNFVWKGVLSYIGGVVVVFTKIRQTRNGNGQWSLLCRQRTLEVKTTYYVYVSVYEFDLGVFQQEYTLS